MKTEFLISLCFALTLCVEVNAEGEQEVKRGLYPFMAFLYYPDESVIDGSGARFLRGAVLIQPDWLVTSAVGLNIASNSPNGFPRKTLLARAGATSIDSNFTLNEDEDEQEREIVQIVRPHNHNATHWWHSDISLMRTLQPFNMTSAVSATMLVNKLEYTDKTCTILVYAKRDGNWTEDKNLMALSVELLPPSVANCGPHFVEKAMSCATISEENKNVVYDPNFCLGNRGGPLICEGDVIGIQTYIENDCKQPHLYQMLSAWDNLIACSTEDKCNEEHCSKICDITNKDPSDSNETTTKIEIDTTKSPDVNDTTVDAVSEVKGETQGTTMTAEAELTTVTVYPSPIEHATTEAPTTEQPILEQRPTDEPAKEPQNTEKEDEEEEPKTTKIWPREKLSDSRKTPEPDNLDNPIRQPKVEAQQHNNNIITTKKRSAGDTNVFNHSLIFGYFILARFI